MSAVQIQEMRAPHDAVLDLVIAHPFWTLRELSRATGYSVPWLSTMIRSDCFQQAYADRRGDVESGIMLGISEKLNALAHIAIDDMTEMLVKGNLDVDERIDAFDKVLHRTGYAPNSKSATPPGPAVQQNFFVVDKSELSDLREKIVSGETLPAAPVPQLIDAGKGDA